MDIRGQSSLTTTLDSVKRLDQTSAVGPAACLLADRRGLLHRPAWGLWPHRSHGTCVQGTAHQKIHCVPGRRDGFSLWGLRGESQFSDENAEILLKSSLVQQLPRSLNLAAALCYLSKGKRVQGTYDNTWQATLDRASKQHKRPWLDAGLLTATFQYSSHCTLPTQKRC